MMTVSHRIRRLCAALALPMSFSAQAGLIEGSGSAGGGFLGGTAINAFTVNPDGIGHHLIIPVYNAQDDNATVISLSNVDTLNAKAVKVRFRNATNADSVFNLTVFLAPGDVWNGVVTRNSSTGLAQFSTGDASCTLPILVKDVSQPFSTSRLDPALSALEKANRTREGYVEVLTMADIPPSSDAASLFQSIALQSGTPKNCASSAVMATLKDAVTEADAAALGFASPNGSLSATWTVINVPKTLTFSGSAVALMGVNAVTNLPGRGNYAFFPQSDVLTGNADGWTSDPLLRRAPFASKTFDGKTTTYASASLPLVKPAFHDFPDLSTPFVSGVTTPSAQAAMISKLLAVKFVRNNYATDTGVAAATDWLMTMPTKRYSVAMDYVQSKPVHSLMTGYDGVEYFSSDNTSIKDGKVCSDSSFVFYDREEASKVTEGTTSSASYAVKVCGHAGSLLFGSAPQSVLGSTVAVESTGNRAFVNGWGRIDVSNRYTGTPLIGAAFIKAANPAAAPGISGNYGITNSHKYIR